MTGSVSLMPLISVCFRIRPPSRDSSLLVRVLHLEISSLARPTAVVKLQLEPSLDFRADSEAFMFPVWSGPVRPPAAAAGTCQTDSAIGPKRLASDCIWYRTSAG